MQIDPNLFRQQVGRRILEARKAQGLSQQELSLAAGISPRALAYIEHGTISPRLETVQRILSVLGMTIEIVSRSTAGPNEETDARAAEKRQRRPERSR
jgi:transcriptional regulator with XRE-family HTH domain